MNEKEPVFIQDRKVFRSGTSVVVALPRGHFEEGDTVRLILYADGTAVLRKMKGARRWDNEK